jgi:hypothetical protein
MQYGSLLVACRTESLYFCGLVDTLVWVSLLLWGSLVPDDRCKMSLGTAGSKGLGSGQWLSEVPGGTNS